MSNSYEDGLSKLAQLVNPRPGSRFTPTIQTEPAPLDAQGDDEGVEAALMADVDDVLKLAAAKTDNNIFDMQVLIETAAQLIREQIRETLEDEG